MEYGEFFRSWRDESLKAYSKMMQPAVESEGFIKAMNASTGAVLSAQKQARDAQLKAMEGMNVPTRKDLARLSHQVQAAEARALECEDKAESIQAQSRSLEQKLTEAVTALSDMQRRVAALQARIDTMAEQKAPAPTTEAPAPGAEAPAPPSEVDAVIPEIVAQSAPRKNSPPRKRR